jgi:CRISPR system Cascade subunit CasA
MAESYSLCQRSWLPLALRDGRRVQARLKDIASTIDGQDVVRIDTGRPDCDISLTELLIGLLAITMGPEDTDQWLLHFHHPPTAEELASRLAPIERALTLDGPGPRFFQDLEELQSTSVSVASLFIDSPGENAIRENADHFVKRGRISKLSRAGAAIALVTLQTCAPAGGAGNRVSLRGGGPLTTLVIPGTKDGRESTLWQRLWANVPAFSPIRDGDAKRIFPWLTPTRTSNPANGGVATTPEDVHPAQAFFGMPRRVRLLFQSNERRAACDLLGIVDDVIVTAYISRPWGTNYVAWGRGHPLSPYYKQSAGDAGYLPLHLQSSRVGYRQWLGMVTETADLRVPASCIETFKHRAHDFDEPEKHIRTKSRLLAAGYAMDKMKPLDFGEALLPLIITPQEEGDQAVNQTARNYVEAADKVAGQLSRSIRRALFGPNIKPDRARDLSSSTMLRAAKIRFWAATENAFYDTIRDAGSRIEDAVGAGELDNRLGDIATETGQAWLKAMARVAFSIYDDVAPLGDIDGGKIKDVIDGRRMLTLMLAGHGKVGSALHQLLHLPVPEKKGASQHEHAHA